MHVHNALLIIISDVLISILYLSQTSESVLKTTPASRLAAKWQQPQHLNQENSKETLRNLTNQKRFFHLWRRKNYFTAVSWQGMVPKPPPEVSVNQFECSKDDISMLSESVELSARVRTGHRKSGKSISISRPGKSWNLVKVRESDKKAICFRKTKRQKGQKIKKITDESTAAFNFSRNRTISVISLVNDQCHVPPHRHLHHHLHKKVHWDGPENIYRYPSFFSFGITSSTPFFLVWKSHLPKQFGLLSTPLPRLVEIEQSVSSVSSPQ